MNKSQTYQHRSVRVYRAIAWCSVLLTTAVVISPPSWRHAEPRTSLTHVSANTRFAPISTRSAMTTAEEGVLPVVLSEADKARYKAIFVLQKKAGWSDADVLIGELDNQVLLGYVLADRYLGGQYHASAKELATWLENYADLPQAADVYTRVVAKEPDMRETLPYVKRLAALQSYGDNTSMSSSAYDTPYQGSWRAGIASWRAGHKAEAAKYFVNVVAHEDELSPWMNSAAAYWAYRSYRAAHNDKMATLYLAKAAEFPRTFYGILARKQLNKPLGLDTQPVQLTESDVLQMVGDQSVRRIVALTEAGYNDLAEKELRLRFPQADDEEKPRLLALAHELGLASVQISMAHDLAVAGRELDFARFPIPNWQPDGGYTIDPLLLFSLMKQESGFRQTAVSSVGALGLMQLMPQTASLMHKQMNGDDTQPLIRVSAAEPVMNITLGQNYVGHLLSNNLVEGNLFYMLAAYNAGPGRLQEWKNSLNYHNDPLLFVESIPFNETHHYVMQVMTNYWTYSELVGGADTSVQAVLKGHWPSYEAIVSAETATDKTKPTVSADSGV